MIVDKCLILLFLCLSIPLLSQNEKQIPTNWSITDRESIVLDLEDELPLPLKDNIEMAGKKVAAIIYYAIDENKNLRLEKDVIFPQLRTFVKTNEPGWKKYRAYFRKKVDDFLAPSISFNGKTLVHTQVDSIEIGGKIKFYFSPVQGMTLVKTIYPSMEERVLVEEWELANLDDTLKQIQILPTTFKQTELGHKGDYTFVVKNQSSKEVSLIPQSAYTFPVYYGANLNEEEEDRFDFQEAKKSREAFLDTCRQNLILKTPDPILNTLFYFSKIRASESIYQSSMGLVHSPGGGNYYVGIWANDQVEYSGPFFPYLGYQTANTAAFNAYYKFLENIPADGNHIAYAFEVDGHFAMEHLDRGDAAMIAYGTSLYLLNSGNQEEAKKLWPLIEWSLDYCHNNRNAAGAIQSESDEMEGRIETGSANLSTSSLYYGGLKFSIPIAKALNIPQKNIKTYQQRLLEMEEVIEKYFGSTLEGLDTYRYFDGNKNLRHWICLPLTMGIEQRKEGTLNALFNKLWTDNGILVQYDPTISSDKQVFWDRATLYALKGAFKVNASSIAIDKLKQYSTKRLLGDHVPYAVEAYPENNMKHLSAESALYCRIFLEGLLGIEAQSFSSFKITPSLPEDWSFLELNQIYLFGKPYDIRITRKGEAFQLKVMSNNRILFDESVPGNKTVQVNTLRN
jgi:hypothetical protein